MPEYTREEVQRVMAGLLSGNPATPQPPMSDAEFERRYAPESIRDDALIDILREIKNVLITLETPPNRNQSYQGFKPTTNTKPTGPMQL